MATFSQDLDDTIEFQPPEPPKSFENPTKFCQLTRCTSTPLNNQNLTKLSDFISPPPSFDSGFESDLSQRATPIITRSRSRQNSGVANDLKKYPKNHNDDKSFHR